MRARTRSRSASSTERWSGELTFNEYQRLQQGQTRVQNLENRAKADGYVGPIERARIHAAQTVQSARIWVKKHN